MKLPDPSPADTLVAQRLRSLEEGSGEAIDRAGFFVFCPHCGYEGSDRSFTAHPDHAFETPVALMEFVERHFHDHARRKCPECGSLGDLVAMRFFVASRSQARDLVIDYGPTGFTLRLLDASGGIELIDEVDPRLLDVCLDSQLRVGRLLTEMGTDRQDDALRLLRTVAEARDDEAGPRLSAAQVVAAMGRDEEALAEIDQARRAFEDDAAMLHEAGNLLGILALRNDDSMRLALAISWLEKALSLEPDERAPHLALGRIHLQAGNFDEARTHLESAATDQSHAFPAAFHLGLLSMETDHASEAVEIFDQLLEIAPHHPELYRARAQALAQDGRPEEAHAALDEAAKLEPNHPELDEIRATLPPRDPED